MNYPESIQLAGEQFKGKSCLYVLEVEPDIYKFGITVYIRDRLRKHYRDMKFARVVKIYDCGCDSVMCKTESRLKKLASADGKLINKYGKTEIIETSDIGKYLGFIEGAIAAAPQPANNQREVKVQYMQDNVKLNSKKCYDCGKSFTTTQAFDRHKQRKAPCLIRETAPENIHNPNRCIFCNKIFAQPQTLTRHYKNCKIKDGGTDILDEKVCYEQEIRILKEKGMLREDREKEMDRKIEAMQDQLNELRDQMKQLAVTHAVTNNITQSVAVNNNFHIYGYSKPLVN